MEKLICWNCGREDAAPRMKQVGSAFACMRVEAKHQERWRHFCADCSAVRNAELQRDRSELNRLKKKMLFERAQQILEGQRSDMYELREAIDVVGEFVEAEPDRFDSAYEMVAAIILIHNRVHCKPQQKIGKYQVDFILPEEFVVLEIDGYHHENKVCFDTKRDREIRHELGPDWEIVRIATKYLDQNAAKLVDAIHEICDRRAFGEPEQRKKPADRFAKLERCLYGQK